jgi:hypothetical protein
MRVRAVIAIGMLLLPPAASAQRLPLPRIGGGRHPGEPVPLSPQPAALAREIAYRRLNLSIESYPMISHIDASGGVAGGRASSWTAFGAGTRASYRLTPQVAATMDLTSSLFGGPMTVQTAEIGTRLGPERSERRLYPFVDLGVGYVSAYDPGLGSFVDNSYYSPLPTGGVRYSRGFGGIAGVGMEYALTYTFSLTGGASLLRSHMTSRDFAGTSAVPSFALTSYRLMLGVRYNPVRMAIP